MKAHRYLAVTGTIALLLTFFWNASNGSRREAEQQERLRVGDSKGGLRVLMAAAGELNDLPYVIEWANFPTALESLNALRSGALDLSSVSDASFVAARAQGSKARIVAAWRSGVEDTAIVVRPDSAAKSLGDLRGRTICLSRASAGHFLLLRLLEIHRMAPQSVRMAFMGPADCRAALESGAVDAWVSWGLFTDVAEIRKEIRILRDGQGVATGLGMIVAEPAVIGRQKAILEDFSRRLYRARLWALAHPDALSRAIAADVKVTDHAVALYVKRQSTRMVPLDDQLKSDLSHCAEVYHSAGLLAAKLSLDEI